MSSAYDAFFRERPDNWRCPVSICVGEYSISDFDAENVWISHESGEGGQFSREALAKVIDEFFRENF